MVLHISLYFSLILVVSHTVVVEIFCTKYSLNSKCDQKMQQEASLIQGHEIAVLEEQNIA